MNYAGPTLYLGDNGRCTCMAHAGCTAQMTGRDLSGQRLLKLNAAELAEFTKVIGRKPECESCRVRKAA